MKKRLFAIMLALALVLAAVPALAEESTEQPTTCSDHSKITFGKKIDYEYHEVLCEKCGLVVGRVAHKWNDGKCTDCNAEQPATEQPATNEPAAQQPATNEPAAQQPATNEPTAQQPATNEPTAQSATNEPAAQQPAAQEEQQTEHTHVPDKWIPAGKIGNDYCHIATCTDNNCKNKTLKEQCEFDSNSVCTKCGFKKDVETEDTHTHDYEYIWSKWKCDDGDHSITCTRKCKTCDESSTLKGNIITGKSRLTRCDGKVYRITEYNATVTFPDEATVLTCGTTHECKKFIGYDQYYCRPWYCDYPCAPCGHWGCGDVCTRYSNCVPCRNYRTTFRVGGYNCLATPKTGDVSVIGMALISLAGAGAAVMGKKRK